MRPQPVIDAPGLLDEAVDERPVSPVIVAAAGAGETQRDAARHAEEGLQRMRIAIALRKRAVRHAPCPRHQRRREPGQDFRQVVRFERVFAGLGEIGEDHAPERRAAPAAAPGRTKVDNGPPPRIDVRLPAPPEGANCCNV